MAKNEAKITFNAEVGDFKANIKEAKSEMQNLRAEMKLNEAQFKATGDESEYLENKQTLLSQQLDENRTIQENLNAEIEVATRLFGENSSEVQSLERQLLNAQTQEQYLQMNLEECTAAIEANQSATSELAGTISDQQSQLDALKDAYVEATLQYGSNSEQAQNLASEITALSSQLGENKARMDEAKAAAESFDSSVQTAADGSSSAMEAMAETVTALGIADKLTEIGSAAYGMASEFDAATAIIVEGTGATGEALEGLTKSAQGAYGAVKDAENGFDAVASTTAELNTRLGVTGDEATDLTEKFLTFSQATGADATGAVDGLVDVMNRWGLSTDDIGWLMDDLTTANQACTLSVDEMTGYLTTNSVQFQELGYSIEDSIAFMTSLADGGANTSSVMMGMRQAINNLSKETDDVPGSFQQAIDAIADCDSVSEALATTVGDTGLTVSEVFGTRAAQEIAACVQNGNLDIERFSAALEDNQGVMDQTAEDATTMSDRMATATGALSTSIGASLAPAFDAVTAPLSDIAIGFADLINDSPVLQGVIVAVATAIGVLAAAMAISAIIQGVTSAMSLLNLSFLSCPAFWVVTAIVALIAIFVTLWNNCEEFRNFWIGLWDGIKETAGAAKNFFVGVADEFGNKLTAIKTWASDTWNGFTSSINNAVSTAQNKIHAFASSVITRFNEVKTGIADKINAARDAVKGAIDKIKGFFNFKFSWPHVPLPHFSVSPSGWKVGDLLKGSIPSLSIAWYAKGGILTQPTAFGVTGSTLHVGGEAGMEAVLPIERLQGFIDAAFARHSGDVVNNVSISVNAQGDPDQIANAVAHRVFGAIDQAMTANGR